MSKSARSVRVSCPAKVNLNLSIFGRRGDGFHDLRSIVVPITLEDQLRLDMDPSDERSDELIVEGADCGDSDRNVVMQALARYREATGRFGGRFTVHLRKRIPVGAGLGGGSSDAAGTLRALATLFPGELSDKALLEIGLSLGSDVPLFFAGSPVLMEGRGERLTPVPPDLLKRLRQQPVLLFKPPFSIDTGEAYARLARAAPYDRAAPSSQPFWSQWRDSGALLPPGGNRFEDLLTKWKPAVPLLLQRLRTQYGALCGLSGSGSACFLIAEEGGFSDDELSEQIRYAWGQAAWVAHGYMNF